MREVKNYGDFVDLVAEMRSAQKRYFCTRLEKDLTESKSLEKQVDEVLKEHLARRYNKQQPALF